jgi:hypothetical protein
MPVKKKADGAGNLLGDRKSAIPSKNSDFYGERCTLRVPPARASAYLLFRLGASSALTPRVVSALTPTGSYEAVSCTMGDLLGCVAGGE